MKRIVKTITFYDDGTYKEESYYTSPMPSIPSPWDRPWDPSTPYGPIKNKCPKCGLVCEGAMGYVCPSNPCPMGMGGVTC